VEVKIYSKDNCIFCTKAKAVLSSHNPQVLMLDEDYSRDQFFEIFPTAKTFPQIIINGEKIGGFHELERWMAFNKPDEDF
tara:strand:- start:512 stop:751 length:240 start_codon:yes stop_codon:yes gene_type:complete